MRDRRTESPADEQYAYFFSMYYGKAGDKKLAVSVLNDLYKEGLRPEAPDLMYCLGFALYEGTIHEKNGKAEGAAWLLRVKEECSLLDPLHYMAANALRHIQKENRSLSSEVIQQELVKLREEIETLRKTTEDTNKTVHRTEGKLDSFILSVDAVNAELLQKIGKQNTDIEEILRYAEEKYSALDLPGEICDRHEKELSVLFGEDWRNEKRLCNMTCDRLVAARVLLYYSAESDLRDYRGVVISATSALEYELYRRFCEGYIAYLDASDLSSERKTAIKEMRFGREFTMGSLMYYLQESERIDGVDRLRPADERRILNAYLETYVMSDTAFEIKEKKGYTYFGHVYIGKRGERDDIFSVKIRQIQKNYRDKAAHKEIIDRVTASECCREIGIGAAESAVQNIEGVLKDLLTLTKPFVMPQ